jgi:hypothetical protein
MMTLIQLRTLTWHSSSSPMTKDRSAMERAMSRSLRGELWRVETVLYMAVERAMPAVETPAKLARMNSGSMRWCE